MSNAMALYRYDISRDGFDYLSSLGISVSHSTLLNKLQEVESKVALQALKTMKEKVEGNLVCHYNSLRAFDLYLKYLVLL